MSQQAGPAAYKTVKSTFTQPCLGDIMLPNWTRALKVVRLHALVRHLQVGFFAYLQRNRDARPPGDILCRQSEPLAILDLLHQLYKTGVGYTEAAPAALDVWFFSSTPSILDHGAVEPSGRSNTGRVRFTGVDCRRLPRQASWHHRPRAPPARWPTTP